MPIETLIALAGLAFAGSWTPGPNNALLANSGATFGLRRTAPHALGVALGFTFMVLCVGLGLGVVFEASPLLRMSLQWLSVLLLIWIAYKIGTSGGLSAAKNKARPFSFLEAGAFQWVNPKAWAMAIGTTAQFVLPEQMLKTSFIVAAVFLVSGLGSAFAWAGIGKLMQHWLKVGNRIIWFNRMMALLILLSVGLLFIEH